MVSRRKDRNVVLLVVLCLAAASRAASAPQTAAKVQRPAVKAVQVLAQKALPPGEGTDLVATAKNAVWVNDAGKRLPVPGAEADSDGIVRTLDVRLEDGRPYTRVLETHPRWVSNGWVEGRYPLTIPPAGVLSAEVGFIQGAQKSDGVVFEILLRANNRETVLAQLPKRYTGRLASIHADLSGFAGQQGVLVLRVKAGASSGQDWAVWRSARIATGQPVAVAQAPRAVAPLPTATAPAEVAVAPGPRAVGPRARVATPTPAAATPPEVARVEPPAVVPPQPAEVPEEPAVPAGREAFPTDRVVAEAERSRYRYHLRIDPKPVGIAQDGEVDEPSQTAFFRLRATNRRGASAELHVTGSHAWGRHAYSQRWLTVRVPERFPAYLRGIVEALRTKRVAAVQTVGKSWKVELDLSHLLIRRDPQAFAASIVKKTGNPRTDELADRFVAASAGLQVNTFVYVSRLDARIERMVIDVRTATSRHITTFTFSAPVAEIPSVPPDATRAPETAISVAMLFTRVPSIQGWIEETHRKWAKRSLDLVRERDSSGLYRELFAAPWGYGSATGTPGGSSHPVLAGSHFEDYSGEPGDDAVPPRPSFYDTWFLPHPEAFFRGNYFRDYHHFGAGDAGLAYDLLFELRGCPPTTVGGPGSSGTYYSARNWAFGADRIDPTLNGMTFTRAIEEYGKQTFESKRRAFTILGHSVHLLQDQAMPDHARLVAHPGTSMTEPEAYDTFYVCEIIGAEAALTAFMACCVPCLILCPVCGAPCGAAQFAVAYAVCESSINPNKMGYERFAKDLWDMSRIEENLTSAEIPPVTSFDDVFGQTGREGIAATDGRGLPTPLGMDPLPIWVLGVIWEPRLDPAIDKTKDSDTRPYFELTDDVAAKAVLNGAGLIRYFMDSVTPPPFVRRAALTQGARVPFVRAWQDPPPEDLLRDGAVLRRVREDGANDPLYPGVSTTLDVTFGPEDVDRRVRTMRTATASVDDERLPLRPKMSSRGDVLGYTTTFTPACVTSRGTVTHTLRIEGTDNAPHLAGRTPLGDALDLNPVTVARCNTTGCEGYEPAGPGRTFEERFNVGVVEASWWPYRVTSGDLTLFGSDAAREWSVAQGEDLAAELRVVEVSSREPIVTGGESCGAYELRVDPTLETVSIERGRTPSPGPALSWMVSDATSASPTLSITAAPSAAPGTYRMTIGVDYRFAGGGSVRLREATQDVRVISKALGDAMRRGRALGRAAGAAKEMEALDRLGLLDLREGPPRAFDPCELNPELCGDLPKETAARARVRTEPTGKVIFVPAAGETSVQSLAESGLVVEPETSGTARVGIGRGTAAAGTYLVPMRIVLDGKVLGSFTVVASVER